MKLLRDQLSRDSEKHVMEEAAGGRQHVGIRGGCCLLLLSLPSSHPVNTCKVCSLVPTVCLLRGRLRVYGRKYDMVPALWSLYSQAGDKQESSKLHTMVSLAK